MRALSLALKSIKLSFYGMNIWKRTLLPVGIALLSIIIFFIRQIFFGEVFYCCDNFTLNIPAKLWFLEQVRGGVFPLWNPSTLGGMPFFADLNVSLLSPATYLFAILPPFRALTLHVILSFFMAYLGMYMFLTATGLKQYARFLGAIIYAFSGTMVVYTNNLPMISVASFTPWVLWSVQAFIRQKKSIWYVSVVTILTLQVLAGHPQLTYYSWLLALGYLWVVSPWSWIDKL